MVTACHWKDFTSIKRNLENLLHMSSLGRKSGLKSWLQSTFWLYRSLSLLTGHGGANKPLRRDINTSRQVSQKPKFLLFSDCIS